MLKTRIIPTLLWKNFGLVKGIGFESWRGVGSVLPSIKVYNSRDVDELFLLDICGNQDLHDPEYEEISDFTDHCFVPFAFGKRSMFSLQGPPASTCLVLLSFQSWSPLAYRCIPVSLCLDPVLCCRIYFDL